MLSDDGEEFREHGRFLHDQLFRECLQIPLVVRFPRSEGAGNVVSEPVETVDLFPTVLEAAGLAPSSDAQGTSLRSRLAEGGSRPPTQFYVDRFRPHRFGLRRDARKVLVDLSTGEAELYNLIGRLRSERGFGVLLVSHDLHVVMAQSDRVICLNRHVCCSGVPQSVL